MESRDTRSPGRAFLEPNQVPTEVHATGLDWPSGIHVTNEALVGALPNESDHTIGVTPCHSLQDRYERVGSTDCKSIYQSAWTSDQDKQLLHLRDMAQLNWRNIVSYFPETKLDAVKHRYKHLIKSHMGDDSTPRAQTRKRATFLTSSTPQRAAKKCRDLSRTKSRKQANSIVPEHIGSAHCRRVTRRAGS